MSAAAGTAKTDPIQAGKDSCKCLQAANANSKFWSYLNTEAAAAKTAADSRPQALLSLCSGSNPSAPNTASGGAIMLPSLLLLATVALLALLFQ
jgi:hypothetical protein